MQQWLVVWYFGAGFARRYETCSLIEAANQDEIRKVLMDHAETLGIAKDSKLFLDMIVPVSQTVVKPMKASISL